MLDFILELKAFLYVVSMVVMVMTVFLHVTMLMLGTYPIN